MKNVLITGSSHGIGAVAAIAFAKEGYNVGVNGNKNPEGAMKVAEECRKYGVEADIFMYDVSNHDACKEMIEKFIERFGKIDVLVNNAGISQIKLFTDLSEQDWNDVFDALDEIGFEGYYNLELFLHHFGENFKKETAEFAVKVMKNMLDTRYGA